MTAIGKRPVEPLDTSWQDLAACRGTDPELFFGPDWEQPPARELREARAKQVCAGCPVRAECGTYADARPEKYGIFGGLSMEERAQERKRRQRRESYYRCDGKTRAGRTERVA